MTELYEITYDEPEPGDRWPSSSGNIILYDNRGDSWGVAKLVGDVVAMPWCEPHDEEWLTEDDDTTGCLHGSVFGGQANCRREDPVAHWVTAKETT